MAQGKDEATRIREAWLNLDYELEALEALAKSHEFPGGVGPTWALQKAQVFATLQLARVTERHR